MLKRGFYKTLALKKIELIDKRRFIAETLDIDTAAKIYSLIAELNFPIIYSRYSTIMLRYMVRNNILQENHMKEIVKKFYNDYVEEDTNSEEDEIDDFYAERMNYVFDYISEIGVTIGVKVHNEEFRNIVCCDDEYIDLNIFGDLRKSLRENCGSYEEKTSTYDECDWDDEYVNIFQDEATSYCIEGFIMNDYQTMILNNTFRGVDSGILSEVYTQNGNTYITISGMQFLDGLSYRFFIILTLILLGKI